MLIGGNPIFKRCHEGDVYNTDTCYRMSFTKSISFGCKPRDCSIPCHSPAHVQACQDVMYMQHVLVASPECARALAGSESGTVDVLRLMAFLDAAAAAALQGGVLASIVGVQQRQDSQEASSLALPAVHPEGVRTLTRPACSAARRWCWCM